MILSNGATYLACCSGSTLLGLYVFNETLNPAERWTILGALITVVFTVVFKLTNKVDALGENISKSLATLGDIITKDTIATIRLNDTSQQLLAHIAETNRIAAIERDKVVNTIKEYIDMKFPQSKDDGKKNA